MHATRIQKSKWKTQSQQGTNYSQALSPFLPNKWEKFNAGGHPRKVRNLEERNLGINLEELKFITRNI